MKNWLIFGGGVFVGILLSITFAVIYYAYSYQKNNDGITWFDKPGDVIEVKSFEVFQVVSKNAALVKENILFADVVYLLTNDEGKYYYDDEVIKVPDSCIVNQVGIFRYQAKSKDWKTVPIIKIMNK